MSGRILKRILIILGLVFLTPAPALAVYSGTSSTHYEVYQTFFGTGSSGSGTNPYTSSPSFESQDSVGDLGIGNTTSADFGAYAGFNTSDSPYIQMVVTGANLNLGVLSTSSTAVANATFYVRTWVAHGYNVVTYGAPPTNGSYSMAVPAPGTNAVNAPNSEQFGMNLEANTTPTSFGAPPNEVFAYSYGAALAPYSTINHYAYNNGDSICDSTQSTGSTIYTLSYIFNIAAYTYGGQYTFNQTLVATGTY